MPDNWLLRSCCENAAGWNFQDRQWRDNITRSPKFNNVCTFHPVNFVQKRTLTAFKNRKADWVLFHEVMETGDKIYIRDITSIRKEWLLEYAPEYYQIKS